MGEEYKGEERQQEGSLRKRGEEMEGEVGDLESITISLQLAMTNRWAVVLTAYPLKKGLLRKVIIDLN